MSETLKKLYELDKEILKINADTPDEEVNRLGALHEELFEALSPEEQRQYISPELAISPMRKS